VEHNPNEPVHILSLGAGVQSSTLALMAAAGEVTPMPVAAIFADTQDEPDAVYEWLAWITPKLPFPVIQVTKGSLRRKTLELRTRPDGSGQWTKSLLPVFTLEPDGTKGHMQRACTYEYKIMQIVKEARRIGGIKRGQKTIGVVQWIGISLDEASRMKASREPWCIHRFPLIEKRITRYGCLEWMKSHGYPEPPRSACIYCPYHSDKEWARMKRDDPKSFAMAVAFEKELQDTKAQTDNMRGVPYLHASRKPLSQVNFDIDSNRLPLWQDECEGMCGL
jgi:hypothetical protein